MEVVDYLCRPQTEEVLAVQYAPGFAEHIERVGHELLQPRPVEDWIDEMEEANVVLGVFSARNIETTYGFGIPNNHVADVVGRYPDKLVGYGAVDPHRGREALEEIERCVSLGLKGISLSPYMHGVRADDRRLYYPIYELCDYYDLDVTLTGGPGPGIPKSVMIDASPTVVDRVACDFPDLTLVLTHGGYPFVLETLALVLRWEKVYFTMSIYMHLPGTQAYVEGANLNPVIRDKWLFSSSGPYETFQYAIDSYGKLPLTDEAREAVMHDNALRLLTRERRNGQTWQWPAAAVK